MLQDTLCDIYTQWESETHAQGKMFQVDYLLN